MHIPRTPTRSKIKRTHHPSLDLAPSQNPCTNPPHPFPFPNYVSKRVCVAAAVLTAHTPSPLRLFPACPHGLSVCLLIFGRQSAKALLKPSVSVNPRLSPFNTFPKDFPVYQAAAFPLHTLSSPRPPPHAPPPTATASRPLPPPQQSTPSSSPPIPTPAPSL